MGAAPDTLTEEQKNSLRGHGLLDDGVSYVPVVAAPDTQTEEERIAFGPSPVNEELVAKLDAIRAGAAPDTASTHAQASLRETIAYAYVDGPAKDKALAALAALLAERDAAVARAERLQQALARCAELDAWPWDISRIARDALAAVGGGHDRQ